MNRFTIPLLILVLAAVCPLGADTYDERTLVLVRVPNAEDRSFVIDSRIDVVNAGPDWIKALLRPGEFQTLKDRGLVPEVLYKEMQEDRERWKQADAAAAAHLALSYYTASKFNTTNPTAGTLMEHLLSLYNAHPSITRLYNLGATQDGAYDIIAIKVTRNPDIVEAEPKIRLYANIHGDEKGGMMVACDVLDWILANYATSATAQKLVDQAELWFIPMGNPYGNANSTRYNSRGVDLNRNFWTPYSGGNEDCYPNTNPCLPWTEAETRAIRDLTTTSTLVGERKRFTNSLSFHGGEVCFNSIWNYSPTAPGDEPIFWSARTPGTGCSDQNGCLTLAVNGLAKAYQDGCTTSGFWFTEGYDWYYTYGDTNDWSYGQWTDLDTTLEVTSIKTPAVSQIPIYTAEHRQGVLNYMLKTFQGISGVMTDASTGAPLDGTVTAVCTSVAHTYPAIYTDPAAGDFHRVLQPGTYTVTCRATGYDDLVVSGVAVAADTTTTVNCAMSGPCANNPSAVSVTPAGPLTLCPGSAQTLTCGATGGTGNTFQWYDGTNPVAGATSPTYSPNAAGVHSYTCKVSGSGCSSGVMDATPTQITWQTEPTFAGLASVTNPAQATCRLDLAWSAGSTPCPGGITYNVYRSTTPGFTPAPGNRIAQGVTGTSYQDGNGLANGTTYYYKVRAVTVATGTEEANLVERSGAPSGAGSSNATLFSESFDGMSFPPTGWTSTVVTTSSTPAAWARVTTSTNPTGIAPRSGVTMAELNSYHAQSGGSNRLARTANLNIAAGVTTASAVLWVYHETGYASNADRIQVQTSPDGTTWTDRGTAVNRYDGTTGWKQHTIDLSALIGAGNFRIGYLGVSAYGNDTYLDDVSVSTITLVACTTGSSSPPPVKDTGANAVKFTKGAGNTLTVTYDATSCSAQKVVILYNAIGTWTGYAGCALDAGGNGGSTSFDSGVSTNRWYNLVWTQGTTAGHPGFATSGARTWSVGTLCGMTADDQSRSTCP